MYRYVRVNMSTGNVRVFELPRERWYLGGRGLISQVLYTEMDPSADPLCPKNVLVLASGMFAGFPLSCFDEVFLGAKSPSTGRLESVHFMSRASRLMAAMDIRLAIFEGQPSENKQYVLLLDRGRVSLIALETLIPSSNISEMGSYALHEGLQSHFGRNACIISWGHAAIVHAPDASLLVSGSSKDILKNIPGRGISAVMASKGIRAIVLRGGNSLLSSKASNTKAENICHDVECLLCCARLHGELKNTPYAQVSLCRDCIQQTPQVPGLERIYTDLGLYPATLSPEILSFSSSDETALRLHILKTFKQLSSISHRSSLPEDPPDAQTMATLDNIGLCPRALRPEEHDRALCLMADLAAAVYGDIWNKDMLLHLGDDTLNKEKAFNSWAESAPAEYM